ncbi:MAG: carbohydrate-binding family 9-like protein [Cellulosilyticaceae bacterium]
MSYLIKTNTCSTQIDSLEVKEYPWGGEYRPKVTVKMWREAGRGFGINMVCYEKNPKASYHIDNQPVYRDSCMEAFLNFYPEDEGSGYLNFEMNSIGTLLCHYGETSEHRKAVADMGIFPPRPYAKVYEDRWEVNLFIEDTFIKNIYGRADFEKGHVIKANFYKCGDATEVSHYGAWKPIIYKVPSFHRPEYFGELILD